MGFPGRLFRNVADSRQGFSLVETLIALGVASILSYTIMASANLSMRSGQLANRQTSFTELTRGVRMLLDNPKACPGFLRSQNDIQVNLPYVAPTDEVPVGAVYLGASPLAVTGARLEGSDMTVTSISVLSDPSIPVDSFLDAAGVPYKRHYLNLALTASVPAAGPIPLGGKKDFRLKFPFVGIVNQKTGLMETCAGTQSSALFWVKLTDLSPYYFPPPSGFSMTCMPGDGNFMMATTIACHRWCGGCGPTPGSLCTGDFPGRGFTSGTSNMECNSAGVVGCICLR